MIEKSDRIKELQDQVETLQKRLAQTVADTSSQAYVGIKAMHEKFKQDQEKYATDLLAYQDEIDQLKMSVKRKVKFNLVPNAEILFLIWAFPGLFLDFYFPLFNSLVRYSWYIHNA